MDETGVADQLDDASDLLEESSGPAGADVPVEADTLQPAAGPASDEDAAPREGPAPGEEPAPGEDPAPDEDRPVPSTKIAVPT